MFLKFLELGVISRGCCRCAPGNQYEQNRYPANLA